MHYRDVREEIKTGDLLGWTSDKLIGNMIRMWTRSDFSHVGIAFWVREGDADRLLIAESREGVGVQVRPLSQGESFEWIKNTGITDEIEVREHVWETIGARYDWYSIWRKITFRPMAENSQFTCNEWASKALMIGGVVDQIYQDPGQLMKTVRQMPGRSQVFIETD